MFSTLRERNVGLFFMDASVEDCLRRNDYDGLVELQDQWSGNMKWEDRTFEEQEFLLCLSCEILSNLKKRQYVQPKRLILKFS